VKKIFNIQQSFADKFHKPYQASFQSKISLIRFNTKLNSFNLPFVSEYNSVPVGCCRKKIRDFEKIKKNSLKNET
jgi:hypothetical protein